MVVIGLLSFRYRRERIAIERVVADPLKALLRAHLQGRDGVDGKPRMSAPITRPKLDSRDYEAVRWELSRRRAKRTTAKRSCTEAIKAEREVDGAAVRRGQRNGVAYPETIVVVIIGQAGVRWLLMSSWRTAKRMCV